MKKSLRAGELPISRKVILGIQHMFAMFGATVLVPNLTGLNPSVALFTSAVGTIIFHVITKGQVPAYLGSSFAFIAPIIAAKEAFGIPGAMIGSLTAGLIYILMSGVIRTIGTDFIEKYLPPVVVGPVIMTIGLGLAPTAKDMASAHLPTAIFTLAVTIVISIFAKGLLKVIPILIGIISGYIFAFYFGIVDLAPVQEAAWLAMPNFSLPSVSEFSASLPAVLIIAPIAIVTMVEHLGDVLALGSTVDREFIEEPGLHRTLLGDGVATAFAALLGGPPNTTYGENIGVLAITKVHNPVVIEFAAVFVLGMSFIQKVGALIRTIPPAVMGGIVILLFGMIAAIGLRTLIENQVDLSNNRNLVIVSTILVIGISGLAFNIPGLDVELAGMGLAAIVGIILNILLPESIQSNPQETE
ncbi:uracil-xanthine permease family protein [Selenihalanaerobacter shriftii]|uniref:Uracil permease n=1 Tax=Selenihalanaerobacter shriftii TaxID=142842 RepID=A0A1T4QG05_9FIRM|nr:solute carrier family 23 protein [Selenihalanaerobacter shriftii]SKA02547.1 uracil permease [Selenihalanaerobacter shriftii]